MPEQNEDEKNTKSDGLSILSLLLLVCLNSFVNNLLKKLKDRWPRVGMYLQSSPISVVFGFVFGYLIFTFQGADVAAKLKKSFEPLFMNFFLPFIIIDGAVNAFPKRSFFRNIVPVLSFAVLGTGIAIVCTGLLMRAVGWLGIIQKEFSLLQCFIFASLVSATDTVAVLSVFKEMKVSGFLYSIIYGESMLNDVIGYTTYQSLLDSHLTPHGSRTASKVLLELFWVFMSVCLGYGTGLLVALLCRFGGEPQGKEDASADIDNTLYSTDFGVMFLSPWIAYLLAEAFDVSAILTIFFCGLALGQFAIHNLSPGCRTFTAKTYGAISEICESISFIYIGVSFYGFNVKSDAEKYFSWLAVVVVMLILFFARALNVVVCSFLADKYRQKQTKTTEKFMIWFSGLRGAMTFALGLKSLSLIKDPEVGYLIYRLSVVICCITIFGQSLFIEPLMSYLQLLGVEDPEDSLVLQRPASDLEEKCFADYVALFMDKVFLKHPRPSDCLDASSIDMRGPTLSDVLTEEAPQEKSAEITAKPAGRKEKDEPSPPPRGALEPPPDS